MRSYFRLINNTSDDKRMFLVKQKRLTHGVFPEKYFEAARCVSTTLFG